MALKETWNALFKKDTSVESQTNSTAVINTSYSDLFPVVKIPETSITNYKKIPVTSLARIGAAFSKLPESVLKIANEKKVAPSSNGDYYIAINPKNLSFDDLGNHYEINSEGKKVIKGRVRFQKVEPPAQSPATPTSSLPPVDPMMMMVAVALFDINQKLDSIQSGIEDIMQFLVLDKQAKQRGNLKKLTEIADDYKTHCNDTTFCENRNHIVQEIQTASLQDIEFYQGKLSADLQKQKAFHVSKDADKLLDSTQSEFAEYQLACYIYSYCGFLDVMLRKDFNSLNLERTIEKMEALSAQYDSLYQNCFTQVDNYQRSTIEKKVVSGLGIATTGLGKMIASIPVIRDGQLDEALINAGQTIGEKSENKSIQKMEAVKGLSESKMIFFINSLNSVNALSNTDNSLLTDGENLFVMNNGN